MGMTLYLGMLSARRRELLEEDPELLWDVIDPDEQVPGVVCLGKAWNALQRIVEPWDADRALAGMFGASGGTAFGESGSYGHPRMFEPANVAQLAVALARVPADAGMQRCPKLRGVEVHGDFFAPSATSGGTGAQIDDEALGIARGFDRLLDDVRVLLRDAAAKQASLFAVIV
ncbi:MAG: DUF1877 family protein [Kofleriaceae bacterium]